MTFDIWNAYGYEDVLEHKNEISNAVPFLAPSGPPQNLQVFNATTTSLTTKWDHAPGKVQNYRITYVPIAGGRSQSVKNISTFFMFIWSGWLITVLQVMCSTNHKQFLYWIEPTFVHLANKMLTASKCDLNDYHKMFWILKLYWTKNCAHHL